MQGRVLILGSVLLAGSIAHLIANSRSSVPESPAAESLGSAYLLDDARSVENVRSRLDQVGYGTAEKVFLPALIRDAGSADRWSDVGEALLAAGDRKKAEYCYRRAAQIAPLDLQTLLNVGDFHTSVEQPREAVAAFSAILAHSTTGGERELRHNVFSYYERLEVRQKGMLDAALPDTASAHEYVRYLMEGPDPKAVRTVWTWAQEKGFDDDALTVDCVRYFFQKQEFESAQQGWRRHFKDRYAAERGTLVFNGGFEHEFAGSDFDWHFAGFEGVTAKRDHQTYQEGTHSLRVDFTGNDNPDFRHVSETVFLEPGGYRFQAFLRTRSITGEQGVRFSIREVRSNRVLAETEALTGTNDWRRIETSVVIPPGATMVSVELARHRSLRIDNQLTGTVWADGIRLTRQN